MRYVLIRFLHSKHKKLLIQIHEKPIAGYISQFFITKRFILLKEVAILPLSTLLLTIVSGSFYRLVMRV